MSVREKNVEKKRNMWQHHGKGNCSPWRRLEPVWGSLKKTQRGLAQLVNGGEGYREKPWILGGGKPVGEKREDHVAAVSGSRKTGMAPLRSMGKKEALRE